VIKKLAPRLSQAPDAKSIDELAKEAAQLSLEFSKVSERVYKLKITMPKKVKKLFLVLQKSAKLKMKQVTMQN